MPQSYTIISSLVQDVSERFGDPTLTANVIQKLGVKGKWPRVKSNGFWCYAIPADEKEFLRFRGTGLPVARPALRPAKAAATQEAGSSQEYEPAPVPVQDTKYWSEEDTANEVVLAYIPFLSRALRVPFSVDKEIHRAYSSDGGDLRVKQIAHHLNWRPKVMAGYLKARGLTHASHVWPDWEVEATDLDDLVQDAIIAKAEKAKARAERLEITRIQKDSEIGRSFRACADHLLQVVQNLGTTPRPVVSKPHLHKISTGKFDVYFPMKDLHIGKRPVNVDYTYSLAEQEDKIKESIDASIHKVVGMWGVPTVWRLVTGDDQLNSNSSNQQTLAGTPQGASSIGSFEEQAETLIRVKIHQIDTCLSYGGSVYDHYIRSNHGPNAEFLVAHVLAAYYRNDPRVTFDLGHDSFKTFASGSTPILDCHGHGVKDTDLPALGAQYALPGTDLRKLTVFRGHTHSPNSYVRTVQTEREMAAVHLFVVPSCAPSCEYERGHGWHLARPSHTLYRVHYDQGVDSWARTY